MQCKICNTECNDYFHLVIHVQKEHKLSSKDYYDKYLKQENEEFCNNPNCNNKVKYIGISTGYRHYCSCKCSMTDPVNQANHKATCLKKNMVQKIHHKLKKFKKRNFKHFIKIWSFL